MKASEKDNTSLQQLAADELADNGSILKTHKKKKKKDKSPKTDNKYHDTIKAGIDQDYDRGKSLKKHKRKREKSNREQDTDTGGLNDDLNKKRKKHKTNKIKVKYTEHGNDVLDNENEIDSSGGVIDNSINIEVMANQENMNNKQERNDKVKENDERKLKKRCKKKKSKKKKHQQSEEAVGADKKAIEYLKLWKFDRNQWSFQKVRQVWLLQHMYHPDKVSDTDFAILLEYLEGLQGRSRNLTLEEAQRIISAEEDKSDTETKADTEVNEDKIERARQVLQLLT